MSELIPINVLLVPLMPTMPEGYLIQQTGYSASVTASRLNIRSAAGTEGRILFSTPFWWW